MGTGLLGFCKMLLARISLCTLDFLRNRELQREVGISDYCMLYGV